MTIEQQNNLLEKSILQLENLKQEVGNLKELRKDIEDTRNGVESLPNEFIDAFEKTKLLLKDFTQTTDNYVKGLNKILIAKTEDFQKKIEDLKKEIDRVSEVDLKRQFNDLQIIFLDQTKKDLQIEYDKIDAKTLVLQTKIDALNSQIERLEGINFQKGFDDLQQTLAQIFGAINSINATLTNISGSITNIVQSLGNIQSTIDTNQKEEKQILANFEERIDRHLTGQDNQSAKDVELLESKMKTLAGQNELLEKEVKTNRTIQIVGITIILIILIYIAATKH
jgi:hypothetical protein